jgi:hypothetical protein
LQFAFNLRVMSLAFIAAACWRTMLLRRLDTRSGGVTWPAD